MTNVAVYSSGLPAPRSHPTTFASSALTASADLVLDTSAAVALLVEDNTAHDAVQSACAGATLGLAGHASAETYSVLTRLPGPNRLSPSAAADAIRAAFPQSISLSAQSALTAVDALADAEISGGAVYDGLVALCARDAGATLVTCDRRAMGTYAALGVTVRLVSCDTGRHAARR
ncbi:PIN domain-containing protein [Microbacterium sp. NPDC091662]|uniref:PIN domain-containing protein n=1 Tax=Microbacterium sp. NPDC091662 TaxID=3364211 RepID=UPI0038011F51